MPLVRGTDEIQITQLPQVGAFLTNAGAPLSVNPAQITVEVMNEDNGLSSTTNVNANKKTTDGMYSVDFRQLIAKFAVDNVYFIVLSSGIDTIDSISLGRFKIVNNLDSDEVSQRIEEVQTDLKDNINGLRESIQTSLEESGDGFNKFDEKITENLQVVSDAVRNVESTLTLLRKRG